MSGQDVEVTVMMVMMMGAGGVVWPLCHVLCCTCSTSWCYQGPLVSLALDSKLPESIEWGQGGGCAAAAGAQFLPSDCRRPDCSPLACEIARFFKNLICLELYRLDLFWRSQFKNTESIQKHCAVSLYFIFFFHKAWNSWISCKWTLQWWGTNCIVYHSPEFLK